MVGGSEEVGTISLSNLGNFFVDGIPNQLRLASRKLSLARLSNSLFVYIHHLGPISNFADVIENNIRGP